MLSVLLDYWNNAENRKKFFVDYAKHEKFDPLIPAHWYSQPNDRIMAFPVRPHTLSLTLAPLLSLPLSSLSQ